MKPSSRSKRCAKDESRCKHGNVYTCGFCRAEEAVKCAHGNPFYCGFCKGAVVVAGQTSRP